MDYMWASFISYVVWHVMFKNIACLLLIYALILQENWCTIGRKVLCTDIPLGFWF